jgi:hypothetical protein
MLDKVPRSVYITTRYRLTRRTVPIDAESGDRMLSYMLKLIW